MNNTLNLWKVLLHLLIQVGLRFLVLNSRVTAGIIEDCGSTEKNLTTSCIQSYAEVYNALSSQENSFAIESALYPAKKPPSVYVKVAVYGFNQTTEPVCYSWSISCLYAALHGNVLQTLSLGSILVTPRTQELNVTIPLFCCNVSELKRRDMIEGVLAALQDLAVSPAIRDPRLNSAECIVKGHTPDISGTGRGPFIRAILWCPFGFTVLSSPLVALYILKYVSRDKLTDEAKTKMKKTVLLVCSVLLVCEAVIHCVTFYFNTVNGDSDLYDIYIILGLIWLVGLFLCIWLCCDNSRCDEALGPWLNICVGLCVPPTVYVSSWLVIGVMLDPTWGLTISLLAGLLLVAFTFTAYLYFDGGNWFLLSCLFGAGILLAATVVTAGQLFYGRITLDNLVKSTLIYALGAFISWEYWSKTSNPASQSLSLEMKVSSLEKRASSLELKVYTEEAKYCNAQELKDTTLKTRVYKLETRISNLEMRVTPKESTRV